MRPEPWTPDKGNIFEYVLLLALLARLQQRKE